MINSQFKINPHDIMVVLEITCLTLSLSLSWQKFSLLCAIHSLESLMWEFGVGSNDNPLVNNFCYSHHFSARYFIGTARRNCVLVMVNTHFWIWWFTLRKGLYSLHHLKVTSHFWEVKTLMVGCFPFLEKKNWESLYHRRGASTF